MTATLEERLGGRLWRRCQSSRSKPSSEGPLGPPFRKSSTCSRTATAMFVGSIGTSIPQIFDLLKDSDSNVRKAAVETLLKLSEQAEFRGSIGTAIPQIIDLLRHNDRSTRSVGANALLKLSEQAEFRGSIGIAIPQIVDIWSGMASLTNIADDSEGPLGPPFLRSSTSSGTMTGPLVALSNDAD
ncbi:hypothetical protein B0H11DRAFT_1315305 [Mycena galericulata]|nr:hypothetical protein B0H11DRAFT_1315305 [Mycena galericulata]